MDYLPLKGRRRGFTPRALVSYSITHRCVVLVFASLFPYLCLFIFCCGCDFKLGYIVYQFCLELVFIFRTFYVCHIAWIGNFWFGGLNVLSVFHTIWTFIIDKYLSSYYHTKFSESYTTILFLGIIKVPHLIGTIYCRGRTWESQVHVWVIIEGKELFV